jgi:LytS/YehU family sensor histidine kinase
VIEKIYMTKAFQQTVVRSISRKREQIATLREELEDLNDYLDLVEARVRDQDKPRLTHSEVKKRYGLK